MSVRRGVSSVECRTCRKNVVSVVDWEVGQRVECPECTADVARLADPEGLLRVAIERRERVDVLEREIAKLRTPKRCGRCRVSAPLVCAGALPYGWLAFELAAEYSRNDDVGPLVLCDDCRDAFAQFLEAR